MQKFFGAAALAAAMSFSAAAQAQFLIIGNDEKVSFNDGKQVLNPPGKDTVTIVDIKDRPSRASSRACSWKIRSLGRRPIWRSRPTTSWRWSPIRST